MRQMTMKAANHIGRKDDLLKNIPKTTSDIIEEDSYNAI